MISKPTTDEEPSHSPPQYAPNSITRDAVPYPGETFIILDRSTNRPITLLHDGVLQLGDTPYNPDHTTSTNDGHIHWLCVERHGWLGFRSPTGRYIGQSSLDARCHDDIEARVTRHRSWEYFCVRRHPKRAYILLMPIEEEDVEEWRCKLWKLEVGEDEKSLVIREDGGLLWEFIQVNP